MYVSNTGSFFRTDGRIKLQTMCLRCLTDALCLVTQACPFINLTVLQALLLFFINNTENAYIKTDNIHN